jgi:hypothetical protein
MMVDRRPILHIGRAPPGMPLVAYAGFAQVIQPFTTDELYRAYRRIMPEAEALELAGSEDEAPPQCLAAETKGLGYRTLSSVTLADDTLTLLSLVSEELDAKVDAYRALWREGKPESPEEKVEWASRRREIMVWIGGEH